MSKKTGRIHQPLTVSNKMLQVLICTFAVASSFLWLYLLYLLFFDYELQKTLPYEGLFRAAAALRDLVFLTISLSGFYILIKARTGPLCILVCSFLIFHLLKESIDWKLSVSSPRIGIHYQA